MSSVSATDPSIDQILTFWFDDRYPVMRWFAKSDELDKEIKDRFGHLVVKARTAELDSWTERPQGALAMVILLDQFCRNLYRGSSESFSSDSKALNISIAAIAKGFDRELPYIQQSFFYTPFMHDEDMKGQVAGRALYEGLANRCEPDTKAKDFATNSIAFSQQHMDVIVKFGRFPRRNKALARESTSDEITYLEENPHGF